MIRHCMTVTKGWTPRCTTLMWQYMALDNGDVKDDDQAPVFQMLDSTIHRINCCLVDNAILISLTLIHWTALSGG